MPSRTRRAAGAALAVALPGLLGLTPAPAGAADPVTPIVVDTTDDLVDPVPGDGTCGDGSPGTCALRAAIQEANATAGVDVVQLASATYVLTIEGTDEDLGATGDLDIADELTIVGAGAGLTVVDGAGIDRVFHAVGTQASPSATVHLEDLTVTGGQARLENLLGNGVLQVGGGGIASTGDVDLSGTTFVGNAADASEFFFGGGGAVHVRGRLTVADSTFEDNHAAGGDASGGAIYAGGGGTVAGSTITGNAVDDLVAGYSFLPSGGGGLATSGLGASFAATDTTFDDNHVIGDDTTVGGSVYASARTDVIGGSITNSTAGNGGGAGGRNLTLELLTVSGNEALAFGGGVATQSSVQSTLRDVVITGNSAQIGGGAAAFGTGNELAMTRTTIAGNTATLLGGGLAVAHPGAEVRTSWTTISGNVSLGDGGGVGATDGQANLTLSTVSSNDALGQGGGLHVGPDATASLTTTTLTSNRTPVGEGGEIVGVGGVRVEGALTLQRSIVGAQGAGPDCGGPGAITSDGQNLESDGTCGLDDPTDVVGDPNLGPLQDNGGTTLTHEPQRPSLVFDRGGVSCGSTDQRTLDRPQNLACDIGAVEVEPSLVFSDIGDTHPFRREIWWLWANGLTNGYPDGTFGPGAEISRQALVVMLWREQGSPPPPGPSPFSDVPAEHPFHDAIAWGATTGLIGGFADGTFRPGAAVSRQAFAALLWRQAGKPIPANPSPFVDVDASHPFHDAIVWAAESKLTLGYPDLTFRPGALVSRQALAAFMARYRTGAL